MKQKNIYTILAVVGVGFLAYKFIIKPRLVKTEVKDALKDREIFTMQQNLISQELPQETNEGFTDYNEI